MNILIECKSRRSRNKFTEMFPEYATSYMVEFGRHGHLIPLGIMNEVLKIKGIKLMPNRIQDTFKEDDLILSWRMDYV